MILKINGHNLNYFNSFTLNLVYNSVASSFSFNFVFEPANELHRSLFKPGTYHKCVLEHNGEVLITGIILSHSFSLSDTKEAASLAGYSLPGVLEDCEIPTTLYPLQSDGLSLRQIAEKFIKPFNLKLVVENENSNTPYYKSVSDKADEKIEVSTAYETQSIKEYLNEIAAQKNVTLSHDSSGNLLLTRAKTNLKPLMEFNGNIPGTKIALSFDGQSMHSIITVQKQADSDGGNAGESSVNNPYASVYRPKVLSQTSGTDINTQEAARNALGYELAKIRLTITTDRWEINGKIIKPNNIVSVQSDELYLYKKSNWFIESISFTGNESSTTAVLTCVLPEVYNNSTPKNIFN